MEISKTITNMNFKSILFKQGSTKRYTNEMVENPDMFKDLNIDKIIDGITAGKKEYDLKIFFFLKPKDMEEIIYRQEIMKDLQDERIFVIINNFSKSMLEVKSYLKNSRDYYYELQKERWLLEAINVYCNAVSKLQKELQKVNLKSEGLISFRDYLDFYCGSEEFVELKREASDILNELSCIQYCLFIRDNVIKVKKYENEPDYYREIEKDFERFNSKNENLYKIEIVDSLHMNHIEAEILERVSKIYSNTFSRLKDIWNTKKDFISDIISSFDKEVQFYISYIEFMNSLEYKGLKFCYPEFSIAHDNFQVKNGFNMALAYGLLFSDEPVILNSFRFDRDRYIMVVTGPNQGGKTTFARMIGQILYFANLGLPVPGEKATVPMFDHIFTHFERQEEVGTLKGKLEEELTRLYKIIKRTKSNSVLILNEIFTSTTLEDAEFLSRKLIELISQKKLLTVWVTFLYEIVNYSENIISMVSTVLKDDPSVRTFKIVEKQPDGLAYAISMARKYQLTYNDLKERLMKR